jgi:hypothetical protein
MSVVACIIILSTKKGYYATIKRQLRARRLWGRPRPNRVWRWLVYCWVWTIWGLLTQPQIFWAKFSNQDSFTRGLRFLPGFPRFNVSGGVYNRTMKKRKPPLNKVAQATRNAHSAELFRSLLLNKHLVATPATRKGSRKANIQKAIKEYN